MLEIEQERQGQAGRLQVAEALSQMCGGEAIHAFQLDDENVFDYQVRLEFTDKLALVDNWIGELGHCCDASKS
jgi:hypothetical protein